MLRYLSLFTLCDTTFVLFLVSWLLTRQIGLSYMIYTAWVDAPRLNTYKWDPATEHYMTENSLNVFIGMEIILLGLATTWFYMACKVAVRVVTGQGAEDVRSDDEDEVDLDGKSGLTVEVGDEASSGMSSPASSISRARTATPLGIESLEVGEKVGGGLHVPQVLKGLQCKRELREEEGARRRK
jgi:acyl-CoA-dependent ceramide synthase